MSEHVSEWLSAYLDGELHGLRLNQVEAHLNECAACRSELKELRDLSTLLKDTVPTETFMPTERFVANLTFALPRRPAAPKRRPVVEALWWLAPVTVLGGWFFVQTVSAVSSLVSTANIAGLFGNAAAWLQSSPHASLFSATMNVFGSNLSESAQVLLSILDDLHVLQLNFTTRLLWQAAIGILYWIWLALWWTRRRAGAFPSFPQSLFHS